MVEVGLKDWLVRFFFMILFCFMINRLFFFSPGAAEVTSSYILYPILKVQNFVTHPIATYLSNRSDRITLQKNIIALQAANDTLQAQVTELESIVDFEYKTAEIRDFAKKYDFSDKKLVHVLLRSFDDAGHFYWVDAGFDKGVSCNMIAVYKNNIIGRVIHVDQQYSKIALITDKRCKIAAFCAKTKSVGVYEGNNSSSGLLEFVPHYEKLEVDDLIISSGQGLVYPQGFAIGKIQSFQVCDVAYKVIVQPLIDIQQLDYVYLITL